MNETHFAIYRRGAALVLLCCMLALGGCGGGFSPVTPSQPLPDVEAGKPAVLKQAQRAWENDNMTHSEILYGHAVDFPDLTPEERDLAFERYVISALANDHVHLALNAAERWADESPGIQRNKAWQKAYLRTIKELEAETLKEQKLLSLFRDDRISWSIRTEAALLLSQLYAKQKRMQESLEIIAVLHEVASTMGVQERAEVEAELLADLKILDDETLHSLLTLADPENRTIFPFTMIRLELASRHADSEETWPRAWQDLNTLMQEGRIHDRDLVSSVLEPLQREKGRPVLRLGLTLPLSGPFNAVSWKILRGAGIAQWNLARTGLDVELEVINTESADWKDRFEELDDDIRIIGGPLRSDIFRQIVEEDFHKDRALFTFLSGLGMLQEGSDAWRFFPGPEDQVRTLLDFIGTEFGIQVAAVLHPKDRYGARMAKLFEDYAFRHGIFVETTMSYPPHDTQKWSEVTAEFLKVDPEENEIDHPLPPEPGFQAVFLPDGWNQAEMLVPQFFFHQEERLLILGSALWSQTLAERTGVDTRYFRLAVFPGAWWPDNPAPAAGRLRYSLKDAGLGEADFWVALGYDFVRFAAGIGGLTEDWTPEEINSRLSMAGSMDWSLAPIHWNAQGIAEQDLFIFRPSESGLAPVDTELLRQRLKQAVDRHDQRVNTIIRRRQAQAEEEALKQQEPPETIQEPETTPAQ